jgi:citrate synthase
MSAKGAVASGLDGVVVADTVLSDVDGERGQLVIRGYEIETLSGHVTFEDVCALLWEGALATEEKREEYRAKLAKAREQAWAIVPHLGNALTFKDGMDSLRACASHLVAQDKPGDEVTITGALPVFVAAWLRTQRNEAPVAPDVKLSTAADYLRMMLGKPGTNEQVAALDAYLVTVADHGLNASTFTARVLASTGTDMVSCVVAAIGALKGPLHGGAPGPVLDMLSQIGEPDRAVQWLEQELVAGRRIMGMGHRIYRVRDPRAAVLEKAVERLEKAGLSSGRLDLARAVEKAARGILATRYPNRPLHANVEFYTAVLLDSIGIPRELFSCTFGVSRSSGWCAHVQEQRASGRLIRPGSRYVGPVPTAH